MGEHAHTGLFGLSLSIWSAIYASLQNLVLGLILVLVLIFKVQHLAVFSHRSVAAFEEFWLLQ